MSVLTWLDTSDLEFIDTFRERDTRDELGIGFVRDASSDLMFPGTSTVQTRAKYFLLVPWCYLKAVDYARRTSAARDKLDTFTRDREISLMRPLEAGGDVMGLLGHNGFVSWARGSVPANIGLWVYLRGRTRLVDWSMMKHNFTFYFTIAVGWGTL